jgi:hypothetical protein
MDLCGISFEEEPHKPMMHEDDSSRLFAMLVDMCRTSMRSLITSRSTAVIFIEDGISTSGSFLITGGSFYVFCFVHNTPIGRE